MFHFIHTYTEDSFPGLFAKDLFRPGDGLKLMHKNYLPAERSFNEIAKKDGLLWQRVKELGCPFYIDRYQGGIPFPHKYDYDKDLLTEWKNLLGENFLGFQMHEWGSNYTSENVRVMDAKNAWIAEHSSLDGFWEHYIEAAQTDPMALFVEAWSVEEWSEMEHPADMETLLREFRRLWEVRKAETGCDFIPADSYCIAPKIEIESGAKLLLPEIGWQIGGTRLQIAYTRGMAQAAGIPWGVYYECWGISDGSDNSNGGTSAYTIPYASESADNEWTEDNLREQVIERTNGNPENGGSARSLQERMWVYAYFSGAEYMGEEYGVCNTFRNYRDFELGEYGQVKKDFLDFTAKYPDLGKPYTPVAIVLPAELPAYTMEAENTYMGYPLAGTEEIEGLRPINEPLSAKIRTMRQVMDKLLHGENPQGHGSFCMQNGAYPDVFDILHGDMTDAIAKYDYIIDLTGNADFAAAHDNIVTPEELKPILEKLLPCTFAEELHVTYNRTEDGWLVLAANNNGVERTVTDGDRFREDAKIVSDILPRDPNMRIEKMEGSGTLVCENGGYRAELGAGQWMILIVK